MKRKTHALKLSKETVRILADPRLEHIAGGLTSIRQTCHENCTESCFSCTNC